MVFDGFEDGDLNDWDVNDLSITSSRAFEGTNAGKCDNGQGTFQAEKVFHSGGEQIQNFRVYIQETRDSYGQGVSLFNSNGNRELGTLIDNPQWKIDDANGVDGIGRGDYNRWIRIKVKFDWTAGTADVEYKDLQSGNTVSKTGRPLKSGLDVEKIRIENWSIDTYGSGRIDAWFDNFETNFGQSVVSVVTDDASNIGADFATLNGTLDDLGDNSSVEVFFKFREVGQSSFQSTPRQTLSSTQSFSDTVTSLSTKTEHEFKAVFDDGSQVVEGDLKTFTPSPTQVNLLEKLRPADTKSSTEISHGVIQSQSSTVSESLGFEPDVIHFRSTSTNPNFNNVSTGKVQDFGWGHGLVQFKDDGTKNRYAISHGSGSESTNGHFSEVLDNYGILQIVTDSRGDSLQGKIEGVITPTSDGFEADFPENQENQQITYTAYKFTGGDVHVGFFQAENSNVTQSITAPGFKPNFLRVIGQPSLNSMNSTINELSTGQEDLGWGHGVAVENSSGLKQGSIAVSQFSSNIDGHAYTSSDNHVLSLAHMANKTSLDGETKASVSFTSNGFDLNYTTTSDPNSRTPICIYLAAKSKGEPDAGFETTPSSTGNQNISTDVSVDNLALFSSNTVPGFNESRGVGRQTWSWSFGQFGDGFEGQLGYYSNSDSVNAHGFAATSDIYRSLYTTQNGNKVGDYQASLASINNSSYTLNYSNVVSSSSNSNIEGSNEAFAWYGFSSTGDSFLTTDKIQQVVTNLSLTESFLTNDSLNSNSSFLRRLNEGLLPKETNTRFNTKNASFVNRNSNIFGNGAVAFNNDGTKMFVGGSSNDFVNTSLVTEYNLSSSYDISSATEVQQIDTGLLDDISFTFNSNGTFSLGAQQWEDIQFSRTGDRMYLLDKTDVSVKEYSLSTDYAPSTASFSRKLDVSRSNSSNPNGIELSPLGDQLFVQYSDGSVDTTDDFEAGLSKLNWEENFNINIDSNSEIGGTNSLRVNSQGASVFAQRQLDSSITTDGNSVSTLVKLDNQTGDADRVSLIILNGSGSQIARVDLNGFGELRVADASRSTFEDTYNTGEIVQIDVVFDFTNNQFDVFVDNFPVAENQDFGQPGASRSANEVSIIELINDTVSSGQTVNAFFDELTFTSPGDAAELVEYELSNRFDVSSGSVASTFNVVSQESNPQGIDFNNSGTKFFVTGANSASVHQYSCNDSFEVNAASFNKSFDVGTTGTVETTYNLSNSFRTSASSFSFNIDVKNDGIISKLAVGEVLEDETLDFEILIKDSSGDTLVSKTGSTSNATNVSFSPIEYSRIPSNETLTVEHNRTGGGGTFEATNFFFGFENSDFKISSGETINASSNATNDINLSTVNTDGQPTGVEFSDVGGKIFILDDIEDNVVEYTLSTPFDISTASFKRNFDISSEDAAPRGMAFSSKAEKMHVIGNNNNNVYEYTFTNNSTDISFPRISSASGVTFNDDGSKLYVSGSISGTFQEYNLLKNYSLVSASFESSLELDAESPQDIKWKEGGSSFFYIDFDSNRDSSIVKRSASTDYDLSTTSFDSSIALTDTKSATGFDWGPDGKKLFILKGAFADEPEVNTYPFSTSFDLGSFASLGPVRSFGLSQSEPTGLNFERSGELFFINGSSGLDKFKTDDFKKFLTFSMRKPLSETYSVNDSLFRSANLLRDASANLSLSDSEKTLLDRNLVEPINLLEELSRKVKLNRNELFSFNDQTFSFLRKSLNEVSTTDDSLSKSAELDRVLTDDSSVLDTRSITVNKRVSEVLDLQDKETDSASLFRAFVQNINTNDSDIQQLNRRLIEGVLSTDDFSKKLLRDVSQILSVKDEEALFLLRNLQEFVDNNDEVRKEFSKLVNDSTRLVDIESFTHRDVLSEATSIGDFKKFSLSKGLEESLLLNPALVRKVFKAKAESLQLNDSLTQEAILRRAFNESNSVNDFEQVKMSKNVEESFILFDSAQTKSQLFRLLREQFSLTDTERVLLERGISEDISLTDIQLLSLSIAFAEEFDIVDDVQKTSKFFRLVSEDLDLNEADIKEVSRRIDASNNINDAQKTSLIKQLSENIVYSDKTVKKLLRALFASISSTEQRELSLTKTFQEFNNLEDKFSFSASRSFIEQQSLFDNKTLTVKRQVSENIVNTASLDKISDLQRTLSQNLSLIEADIQNVSKVLTQTVNVNDDVQRQAKLSRILNDSFVIDDNTVSLLQKLLEESIQSEDFEEFFFFKQVDDNLSIEDDRDLLLGRQIPEGVSLTDRSRFLSSLELDERIISALRVSKVAELFRLVNQEFLVNDADVKRISKILQDVFSTQSSAKREADLSRNNEEELPLVDDDVVFTLRRVLLENSEFADEVISFAFIQRQILQGVTVNDDVRKSILRSLFESSSAVDDVQTTLFKLLVEKIDLEDKVVSFEPAQTVASNVEIDKLHKAVANVVAARRAVAELEKKELTEGNLDKF